MLPGLAPAVAYPFGSVVPTYLNSYSDTTDLATYNFAATGLAPAYRRKHVVGVGTSDDPSLVLGVKFLAASASGADIVATQLVTIGNGNNTRAALFIAEGVAVASCTIQVTHGVVNTRCAISVFALDNAKTAAFATNSAFANSGSLSAGVSSPAGGAVIGMSYSSTNTSAIWTGLTEVADAGLESSRGYTAAMLATATAQTPQAVTVNDGVRSVVAASFESGG